MSNSCQFQPERFWKKATIPIILALLTFYGSHKARNIMRKHDKASLLATFKDDILKGKGPAFILAREALKEYFTPNEWNQLINNMFADSLSSLDNAIEDKNISASLDALNQLKTIHKIDSGHIEIMVSETNIDGMSSAGQIDPAMKHRLALSQYTLELASILNKKIRSTENQEFVSKLAKKSPQIEQWLKSELPIIDNSGLFYLDYGLKDSIDDSKSSPRK
jgi:hypothetical protein